MLISVIITNYNYSRYLKQCLDSVINQTYPFIEIIIVDDNSTDNSKGIINEYFSLNDNIFPIYNNINLGVIESRNIGIEKSNGKYICFLDADDYWSLDKIEEQINSCEKCDISFSDIYLINENDTILGEITRNNQKSLLNFTLLLRYNFIPHSSLFIDKKLLSNIRYRAIEMNRFGRTLMKLFGVNNLIHEDYDFLLRLFKDKNPVVLHINRNLVYYRKHKNSFSVGFNKKFISILLIYHNSLKISHLTSFFFTIRHSLFSVLKKIKYFKKYV